MTRRVRLFKPTTKPSSGFLKDIDLPVQGQSIFSVVKTGLDADDFKQIAFLMGTSHLKLAEWLGISKTTLYRRLKRGRFNPSESDRAVRAAIMFGESVRLFEGDELAARLWIQTPLKGLDGNAPVQLLQTGVECQSVLDLIGRLEFGVFN